LFSSSITKLYTAKSRHKSIRYEILYSLVALPAYDTPRSEYFWPDVPLIQDSNSLLESNDPSLAPIQRSSLPPEHYHPYVSGRVACVLIGILDSGYVAFLILGRARSWSGCFERLGIFKIHRPFLTKNWHKSFKVREFFIV